MKTRNAILAMLFTVLSLAAHATDGEKGNSKAAPKVEVSTEESNIYRVLFMGNSDDKTTINIRNAENRLVFTETIKKVSAFVRPYNFSQLPDGVYTLEVIEGNTVSKKTIYHGSVVLSIEPTVDLNIVRLSPIAEKEGVYKLTIINSGGAKAAIRILDEDQNVVYSSEESFERVFCKLYNFKSMSENTTIEVKVNGEVKKYEL
ncbi:hypothetical protein JMN32_07575 [Fulvivirga sp. 29W222]|uniref:Uncharacterized protein n=1 Tax=Fulvivirga marina TaxID=2494733 RepID=A0A937KBH6_9BACT|nr:hypothetical protein [Fulvivirga marina]MBL6446162.1 hypothetical protein [Fulvivirga marina]